MILFDQPFIPMQFFVNKELNCLTDLIQPLCHVFFLFLYWMWLPTAQPPATGLCVLDVATCQWPVCTGRGYLLLVASVYWTWLGYQLHSLLLLCTGRGYQLHSLLLPCTGRGYLVRSLQLVCTGSDYLLHNLLLVANVSWMWLPGAQPPVIGWCVLNVATC